MLLVLLLVASVWKYPDSQYWTACFRDQNGRQRRILTKETNNKKSLGTTTRAQRADLIIRSDMNAHEAEHAYDLEPWHPRVHLALASLKRARIRRLFCGGIHSIDYRTNRNSAKARPNSCASREKRI
jgi:hypothetical protein